MVSLPTIQDDEHGESGGGCGSSCGAGLEKIYPTTAVRFGAMNWIGEFRYKEGTVFKCGAKVVIQTDRGIELGQQVSLTCHGCDKSVGREQIAAYVKNSGADYYRLRSGRILREATREDLLDHEHLNARVREETDDAALLAAQMGLTVKFVTVEHLLGGERVVYYFMADGRVDFRNLVRELARRHQTRIEMRQVGPRDEARLVADFEICGRECCCKNFLKTLRPVTMKMAKLQKATLDLSKVSGRCGRLRCCLRYEHEGYEELARKLPNKGTWVRTDSGPAAVVDRQILTQLVMVQTREGKLITIPIEEIREFNVPRPPEVGSTPAPAPAAGAADVPDAPDASVEESETQSPRRPDPDASAPEARRTDPAEAPGPPTRDDAVAPPEPASDRPGGSQVDPARPAHDSHSGAGATSGDPLESRRAPRRRRRRRRGRGAEGGGPPPVPPG